MIIVG